MGQKGNLITLRKSYFLYNLSNFNNKFVVEGFSFLKSFKHLLLKNNVLVINENLNYFTNKLFFNFDLYFETNKTYGYKKNKKTLDLNIQNSFPIFKMFKKFIKFFKLNGVITKINVLNKQVDKSFSDFLYEEFIEYVSTLFERRFTLFIDFIKLTTLYFFSKIDLKTYLYVLSKVFKYIRKETHNQFLVFVKRLFTILVEQSSSFYLYDTQNFSGVKLIINGRLNGKSMASTFNFHLGTIGIQSLDKNVEYAKVHTFTQQLGVFGFKIWVYKT